MLLREMGAEEGGISQVGPRAAIVAPMREMGRYRSAPGGGRTVAKSSAVSDSKGNDVTERAVKSVEAQIRALRSALEERLGCRVDAGHLVLPWMVERRLLG